MIVSDVQKGWVNSSVIASIIWASIAPNKFEVETSLKNWNRKQW